MFVDVFESLLVDLVHMVFSLYNSNQRKHFVLRLTHVCIESINVWIYGISFGVVALKLIIMGRARGVVVDFFSLYRHFVSWLEGRTT